jgi:hypothetical protein
MLGEQSIHEGFFRSVDLSLGEWPWLRLPPSLSETGIALAGSITFSDPVSRKRPGCRFRSIAALITGNSSGTCRISSNVTRGFEPETKPLGSPFTAARMPGSSNLRYYPVSFAQFRRLNEGTFARLPSTVEENGWWCVSQRLDANFEVRLQRRMFHRLGKPEVRDSPHAPVSWLSHQLRVCCAEGEVATIIAP